MSSNFDKTKVDLSNLGVLWERVAGYVKKLTGDVNIPKDGTLQEQIIRNKNKLDGISDGANNYHHPVYTEKTSGFYKITVDDTGHISEATEVTKGDITNLGIPSNDTIGSTVLYSGSKSTNEDDYIKLSDRWDKYSVIYVKCSLTGDGNASVTNDVWIALPVHKATTYNSSYIPIHLGIWDDSSTIYIDSISGSVELIDGYYENLYLHPGSAEELQLPTDEGSTICKSNFTSTLTVTTVIGVK